ncbi:MAG: hypothetical protein NVS1B7_7650 [Candidatus Saccharimonadales bacterium]
MSNFKVAIIEDDLSLANMYALKFKANGFEAFTAANGDLGLELIKQIAPDVILLDIKMPVMSGDEMLLHLRSYEWGANIRVIIMTNISRSEAPRALQFLNVDRYIVKAHHTPSQIINIVQEVIGSK